MNAQHFTSLKNQILVEDNFSDCFDYFFTHFGESMTFHDLGEPSSNSLLPTVLKNLGKNYFGETAKVTNYRMTELPEHNFVHGTCFIDDKLAMVIFFTDIKMGLTSLSMGGAMYNFIHLKATEIEEGAGYAFLENMNPILN